MTKLEMANDMLKDVNWDESRKDAFRERAIELNSWTLEHIYNLYKSAKTIPEKAYWINSF